RAFLVDDLVIFPHPTIFRDIFGRPNWGSLTDMVQHSSLKGYNLDTGKLVWEIGGRFDRGSELAGSFFLGPPMPVDDKLYVLTEKNAELHLPALQCRDTFEKPAMPAVLWTEKLIDVPKELSQEPSRRVQAVPLTHQDDVLICPTNLGTVVAVD